MPNTTGDDEGGGAPPSSASETIAALWREREEQTGGHPRGRPRRPPPARPGRHGWRAPRRRSNDRPGCPCAPRIPPPPPPAGEPAGPPPYSPGPPPKKGFGIGTMAAVVVGALVVAGGVGYLVAGGGGAPSRSTFIAKADAVCRPADALLAITRPTSYPELATAAGIFATAAEGELGQLRQISRPGGSAGNEALTVVNNLGATAAAARGLHEAAVKKDDAATVAAAKKLSTASVDTAGAAGVYGMTACGSGLQPTVQTLVLGTQSVIKAGFTAQADVVCRAAADELRRLRRAQPATTPTSCSSSWRRPSSSRSASATSSEPCPCLPATRPPWPRCSTPTTRSRAGPGSSPRRWPTSTSPSFIVASREITTLGTAADGKLDGYGLGVCGSNFGNI